MNDYEISATARDYCLAPLPLTGWSSVYGAAISYSGGVVASGYTGGMSRSLGGLMPGVMATITLELKYVRKAPCHITVTDDVTSAVIASQSVGSGGFYSLSFTPDGNNVTLSIVEGVSFASSDILLHLESGTYTQQQGWTTAPLAVQLSNKDADKYKFGFNGQEKVNEIAGIGNHTTALFWEYDTRIARRWNIDPKKKDWESDYSVLGLNPIINIDPLGDDWYKNKDGSAVYNKDLSGKGGMNKLGLEGEYIGKTAQWLHTDSYGNRMSVSGAEDGQMSVGMSGIDVGAKGPDRSLNIMQAAERGIGFNAYNRQRATWSRNIAAGWLGAGFAVPAAVVGGVEIGAVGMLAQGGRWLWAASEIAIPKVGTYMFRARMASAMSDVLAQGINKGVENINITQTGSAFVIGNPFLSTLPGSAVNLSYTSVIKRSSPIFITPNAKSIVVGTVGNLLGNRMSGGIRGGMMEMGKKPNLFLEILGQQYGHQQATYVDEMSNPNSR